MSTAVLKKKIKEFGGRVLLPRGFLQTRTWDFEKEYPGLIHGVDFVNGQRGLQGCFTVNLYWRFTHSEYNSEGVMHYYQRVGEFLTSGGDQWFAIDDDHSYKRIERIFIEFVEPFYKEHESIEAIIRSYEMGRHAPNLLFGIDIGWQTYNIGFCYKWLGQNDKAMSFLKEVIEKYSSYDYDWVQRRKQIAMKAIASIEHV